MSPELGSRLRYRRWPGRLGGGHGTWLAVTANGIRLGYRRARTPAILFSSLALLVGDLLVFWLIAEVESLAREQRAGELLQVVENLFGLKLGNLSDLSHLREVLWRTVYVFTLKGQLVWIVILLARVGPGLIANDVKFRALPLYFARPITPRTYLFAKWLVPATFVALVTVVPNLTSLVIGTAITGGLPHLNQTLSLGFDLAVTGAIVMTVAGMIILALSSTTSDSRYVTIAWLAVILIPTFAQLIIRESLPPESVQGFLASISPRENILTLTEWIFDLEAGWNGTQLPPHAYENVMGGGPEPIYPTIVFGAVTLVCLLFSYRRVVHFSRAAAGVA